MTKHDEGDRLTNTNDCRDCGSVPVALEQPDYLLPLPRLRKLCKSDVAHPTSCGLKDVRFAQRASRVLRRAALASWPPTAESQGLPPIRRPTRQSHNTRQDQMHRRRDAVGKRIMIDDVRRNRARQDKHQKHGAQKPPARDDQHHSGKKLPPSDDEREPGWIAPVHELLGIRRVTKDPAWVELERGEEEELQGYEPAQAGGQPSSPSMEHHQLVE